MKSWRDVAVVAILLAACGAPTAPAVTPTAAPTVTQLNTAAPSLTAAPSSTLMPTSTPVPSPTESASASLSPSATPATSAGNGAIAAGYYHTCAVTRTGGVECWGWNDSGQLGDGSTNDSSSPVAVTGLTAGVRALAAGVSHTCALTAIGGVQCWGWNLVGQLGNGTNVDSSSPVAVSGLESGVIAIDANGQYSCALTDAGAVLCWGSNFRGQLGDGTPNDSSTPVAVVGLDAGVSAIGLGDYHACAVLTSGDVNCWGANEEGQLGNGKTRDSSRPVQVAALGGSVIVVSAGYQHTCVLTTVPDVECWGANDFGSLGDGTTSGSFIPVAVAGLTGDLASIGAGSYHTCALSISGALVCWGANDYGQIGDGTSEPRSAPVPISGLGVVDSFSGGWAHTCAVTTDGQIMCWGANDYGQLGNSKTDSSLLPVPVSGL